MKIEQVAPSCQVFVSNNLIVSTVVVVVLFVNSIREASRYGLYYLFVLISGQHSNSAASYRVRERDYRKESRT